MFGKAYRSFVLIGSILVLSMPYTPQLPRPKSISNEISLPCSGRSVSPATALTSKWEGSV